VKGIAKQIQPSNLRLYWPLDEVADGTSADGSTFRDEEDGDKDGDKDGTGDDGANNTGLTARAGEVLSYP